MINKFYNLNYNCYLYYLSYRINKIRNINDIVKIVKNISFFYKNADNDKLIEILIDCIQKYSIKEKTMQTISILQQEYYITNGIEDYCCFILWFSIIYIINNNILLLH